MINGISIWNTHISIYNAEFYANFGSYPLNAAVYIWKTDIWIKNKNLNL